MRQFGESYIRRNGRFAILYILLTLIFEVVLYLYHVRTDALWYAAVLAMFLLVIFLIIDFLRYVRHGALIKEVLQSMPFEKKEFPTPMDITEQWYQERTVEFCEMAEQQEAGRVLDRDNMLDYYSIWAHQVKTPIAAMHLLEQALETTENEAEKDLLLGEMKMELFKTEQYVEMVMSFLRMENMSADLSLKEYSLDNVVRKSIKKYAQMFILKKIKLDYRPCESIVLTDEKWLMFVVEQILSNALKYTTEGTISIYMDSGKPCTLVVEDTGIGIWQEDLPRIFERGFTGYNGRQDKKSTGIGLYLCRSICAKLGHTITVESEVGKGTMVRIDLARKNLHMY